MKQLIIENIDSSLVYSLEKAQFEYDMRKEIIERLLKDDTINITAERFQLYLKELDEKLFTYNLMKDTFVKEFVTPLVPEGYEQDYSWYLKYATKDLIITYGLKDE